MFGLFENKKSATIARDRLRIAIMSDRNQESQYPFMEEMKAEIVEVIRKYIGVKRVEITKESSGDIEALAIEVQLNKE